MSAPPYAVVTVYIKAGVVLCVAFQPTFLRRHQQLSQRNRQLTNTAHPQTSTATAGESLAAMDGQAFSIQCGMRFGEHLWATLTGCWYTHSGTFTRRGSARVGIHHSKWPHSNSYEARRVQLGSGPTAATESSGADAKYHSSRPVSSRRTVDEPPTQSRKGCSRRPHIVLVLVCDQ